MKWKSTFTSPLIYIHIAVRLTDYTEERISQQEQPKPPGPCSQRLRATHRLTVTVTLTLLVTTSTSLVKS